MSDPVRREVRRRHLDASAVPVERALLSRAEALSVAAMQTFAVLGPERADEIEPARIEPNLKLMMAGEFRKLADELYWW